MSFDWTVTSAICGDGIQDPDEECDDGNTTDGDGCSSACTIEVVAVCGDGTVTSPEQCEPPNTDVCTAICRNRDPVCGDGFITSPEACEPPDSDVCDASCADRSAVCGDGFLTPPETCEDGNVVDGDGCSSLCQIEGVANGADLTDDGTIIASVPIPTGGGAGLDVIRDDDFPPVGSTDSSRQYDSWDGQNTAAEAWVGYSYPSEQIFGRVVFQEGREFSDGGWFETLTVEVRQGGVWTEVSGLAIDPVYSGENFVTYETFELTFAPAVGDAIRIIGDPGGSADFISVGELEVYAADLTSATCGDGVLDAGDGEACDDGNNAGGDGCTANCEVEFCGDGVVNNVTETCEPAGTATCDDDCMLRVATCGDGFLTPPEACEPAGTATCDDDCTLRVAVCGDGFLTPPETCEDGNVVDGDGCSSLCQIEGLANGADLTDDGTIIASVPNPLGGGAGLDVIRDDDFPPVGSVDSSRQYDSWDGQNAAAEAWVGYAYSLEQIFGRVVFQEGREFSDGGWFETLTVEVR
ncbi:MAG: DUF4215 domain-containing protein, partial [Actinomycetota bacterium]